MDSNDLTVMDELDGIVSAFSNDDEAALMQASGQGNQTQRTGLPRLSINYDTDTDEGQPLTKGDWKIFVNGQMLFASEVNFRPILRTFEYSLWDAEEGTFACKSVQKPSLSGEFPDDEGGNKCGRLSRDDEETASEEVLMRSRAVACNQILYGQISGTFKTADGTEVQLTSEPAVAYFKKSGYKPIGDFIDNLTRQKKLMQKCSILLRTDRKKKGSVTYFIPVPTLAGEVGISDSDKELMGMFGETVKKHNNVVMEKNRQARKLLADDDLDLADDFNVNAA